MKTLIKFVIVFIVLIPSLVVSSSAYHESYKSDVENEIYELEKESATSIDTPFDIKRKKYLEKRLKTIETIGITEITFTSKLKYNEPINSLTSASYKQGKLFIFIRIQNMKNEYLTHKWFQNKRIKFKKRLKVRSNTWKMWTWVNLNKSHVGNWEVIIYDDNGNIMARKRFFVSK